ncbi:hypothetical protein TNCV_2295091 [Trichonephila clavipes]|nr:hypothetical protein TNCV_2295091 [Trichonephila clavipes]
MFLIPPDRRYQIEAHEIHHGNRLEIRLSFTVALSTIQSGIETYKSRMMSCDMSFHSNSTKLVDCPTCHPKLPQICSIGDKSGDKAVQEKVEMRRR